jgi:hypothetical protein
MLNIKLPLPVPSHELHSRSAKALIRDLMHPINHKYINVHPMGDPTAFHICAAQMQIPRLALPNQTSSPRDLGGYEIWPNNCESSERDSTSPCPIKHRPLPLEFCLRRFAEEVMDGGTKLLTSAKPQSVMD